MSSFALSDLGSNTNLQLFIVICNNTAVMYKGVDLTGLLGGHR